MLLFLHLLKFTIQKSLAGLSRVDWGGGPLRLPLCGCGGWAKCLTSVVSLCRAFVCVVVIKQLQSILHSFGIRMQVTEDRKVSLYLMPWTSSGKNGKSDFQWELSSVRHGQLFCFILDLPKVWKECLRLLFSDRISARRLERPEETSVKLEQCNTASAYLKHSCFLPLLIWGTILPTSDFVPLQQRWQSLLIELQTFDSAYYSTVLTNQGPLCAHGQLTDAQSLSFSIFNSILNIL